MKTSILALVAGLTLMACSPATEPTSATPAETAVVTPEPAPPAATPAVDPAAADTCNMTQYLTLVGKPATDPAVPAASASVRVIKPGDQVTMDFLAARLNIEVDAAGNVASLRCG